MKRWLSRTVDCHSSSLGSCLFVFADSTSIIGIHLGLSDNSNGFIASVHGQWPLVGSRTSFGGMQAPLFDTYAQHKKIPVSGAAEFHHDSSNFNESLVWGLLLCLSFWYHSSYSQYSQALALNEALIPHILSAVKRQSQPEYPQWPILAYQHSYLLSRVSYQFFSYNFWNGGSLQSSQGSGVSTYFTITDQNQL